MGQEIIAHKASDNNSTRVKARGGPPYWSWHGSMCNTCNL